MIIIIISNCIEILWYNFKAMSLTLMQKQVLEFQVFMKSALNYEF